MGKNLPVPAFCVRKYKLYSTELYFLSKLAPSLRFWCEQGAKTKELVGKKASEAHLFFPCLKYLVSIEEIHLPVCG